MTISICILNYSVRSYRFEAHCAVCSKRAAHILTFLFPNAFGTPDEKSGQVPKSNKRKATFCQMLRWQKDSSARLTRSLFSGVALLFLPIIATIELHIPRLIFWLLNEATSLASTALIMCHHRLCGRNAIEHIKQDITFLNRAISFLIDNMLLYPDVVTSGWCYIWLVIIYRN